MFLPLSVSRYPALVPSKIQVQTRAVNKGCLQRLRGLFYQKVFYNILEFSLELSLTFLKPHPLNLLFGFWWHRCVRAC